MKLATALLVTGVLLVASGCGAKRPTLKPLNLSVAPSDTLKSSDGRLPTIRVHLVGVQDAELDTFAKYPVDRWFSPDDRLRRDSIGRTVELTFDQSKPGPQSVDAKNPIWQKWKADRVLHLVMFANLPTSERNQGMEPGKYVLPLNSKRWDAVKEVRVEVQPSKMTVYPPPLPEK